MVATEKSLPLLIFVMHFSFFGNLLVKIKELVLNKKHETKSLFIRINSNINYGIKIANNSN